MLIIFNKSVVCGLKKIGKIQSGFLLLEALAAFSIMIIIISIIAMMMAHCLKLEKRLCKKVQGLTYGLSLLDYLKQFPQSDGYRVEGLIATIDKSYFLSGRYLFIVVTIIDNAGIKLAHLSGGTVV
jgi:hypothetical protein